MQTRKRTEGPCHFVCPECDATVSLSLRAMVLTGHAKTSLKETARRKLTPAGSRKISEAVKRRWAAYRKGLAETARRQLAGTVAIPVKPSGVESTVSEQ